MSFGCLLTALSIYKIPFNVIKVSLTVLFLLESFGYEFCNSYVSLKKARKQIWPFINQKLDGYIYFIIYVSFSFIYNFQ